MLDPNGAVLSGHPPQAPPVRIFPQPLSKMSGDASAIRTATESIFTASFIYQSPPLDKFMQPRCQRLAPDKPMFYLAFTNIALMNPLFLV